jgi:D-alanyl-D-alanine carboxypeptidase/D-alanyl-D-alanine-endopeptidase (penicillin-binding protein 4)
VSYRTGDPIGEAGAAFAAAAGLTGIAITQGTSQGGAVLAQVQSQPISTLVSQMLLSSDNILGENLARVTSVALGFDGSSASLALAIPQALANYGLDVSNVAIRDGSGLSDLNAVSPQFITALMMKIRTGDYGLGVIFGALPVAGESGTLASRFTGANEIARGSVIAKTGWLDAAYTLAGIVNASDGTPLAFAFYSIRDGISSDAKQAQDSLATALFICGDNLSNN